MEDKKNPPRNYKISPKGFLKTIVLIIIALALLKIVWDFDIVKFLDNPKVKEIIDTIFDIFKSILDFLKNLFGSLKS